MLRECLKRVRKDYKNQRWRLTSRKQYSQYTIGQLHIQIHRECGSVHNTCAKPRMEKDKVPPLVMEKKEKHGVKRKL